MSQAQVSRGYLELEDVLRRIEAEPLEACRERERRAFDEIAGNAKERLVLFGAGPLGKGVLGGLRKVGIEPLAFADNRLGRDRRAARESVAPEATRGHVPRDRRAGRDRRRPQNSKYPMTRFEAGVEERDASTQPVMGLPVLSAAEAVERYGKDACFVVTIYQGSTVRKQLAELGCRRVAHFAPLFWKYAEVFIPQGGIDLPHRLRSEFDAIRSCYAALADDGSRRELREQLLWRNWLDYSVLSTPLAAQDTYFPLDLVAPLANEVFVDCGSFQGDTIPGFLSHWRDGFQRIFALEPDSRNQEALTANAAQLGVADRVTVLPYALGSESGEVSFEATGTVTSQIVKCAEGSSQHERALVECRRLDEIEWPVAPTYIKMDIEGAEPDALVGATGLLREQHPVLAVCTYHRSEHLWEIPNLIRSIAPEYNLFLRRYAEECWEGVCYAVPSNRAEVKP